MASNSWATAFERPGEAKVSEKGAVEKLVIQVLPYQRPLLTLIKLMSAGMVCGMDSGLFYLPVCDSWENDVTSLPDLCNGNIVVPNFGGVSE